ncbi:MAG: SDR family NAD(P)-dependent oxidoreductase [Rhizobiales bacterium]|nr:SDR family NAD(P)-dependent oxidoreductase [Hyphomicrobiales bacterium]
MAISRKLKLSASGREWQTRYGPWAVVTGSSNGIGLEIAKGLARRGLNLVLLARNGEALKAISTDLEAKYGIETRPVPADLSEAAGFKAMVEATCDLDIGLLIANAGFGTSGPFIDSDLATELSMIDLNIRALAEQTHHFARRLRARKTGGIILLSSIVSWQGVPGAANYAATKAYVQSLAEALNRELKPLGIDVLASAPAQVSTGFNERANMQGDGASPSVVAENTLKALGKRVTTYPHFMSWFLSTSLSFLPRSFRVSILAGVMDGMTKHQSVPAKTATTAD